MAILPVLHARVGRMLLRFRAASRYRDVRQDVEDMIQQILVTLFADGGKALRAWDPARGLELPGFVGMLAEREVYSILRSRRRSPWSEDPTEAEEMDSVEDAERGTERIIASREIARAVVERVTANLSEEGAAMFTWFFVEDRSVEEICEITGKKRGAVYVWKNRLIARMRQAASELMLESGDPRSTSREAVE